MYLVYLRYVLLLRASWLVLISSFLSCFSYLADSYTLYASSALSAQSFLRNCVGAVFPLFTNQLYAKLGIQGAGSLTAGIGESFPSYSLSHEC